MKRRQTAQRHRFRRLALVFAVLLAVLIVDRTGLLLVSRIDDHAAYDGRLAVVARVIDGDTVEITLPDARRRTATTRVRLWGIDTPELARPGVAEQEGAREAHDFLRTLIEGRRARLRLEPDTRDRYERLLAHLETEEGENINGLLLLNGHARATERWPHSMLREYERLERIARQRGLGIWSR